MKIRKANKKDIARCLALQKLDKENYWKKKDFVSALKDKNIIFIIAEENKKLLGYIIGFTCPSKKTDVMIHESRVSKESRGKRIGTALVKEFCRQSFKKGANDVYALIEEELAPFYISSCKFKKSHTWIEAKKSK